MGLFPPVSGIPRPGHPKVSGSKNFHSSKCFRDWKWFESFRTTQELAEHSWTTEEPEFDKIQATLGRPGHHASRRFPSTNLTPARTAGTAGKLRPSANRLKLCMGKKNAPPEFEQSNLFWKEKASFYLQLEAPPSVHGMSIYQRVKFARGAVAGAFQPAPQDTSSNRRPQPITSALTGKSSAIEQWGVPRPRGMTPASPQRPSAVSSLDLSKTKGNTYFRRRVPVLDGFP